MGVLSMVAGGLPPHDNHTQVMPHFGDNIAKKVMEGVKIIRKKRRCAGAPPPPPSVYTSVRLFIASISLFVITSDDHRCINTSTQAFKHGKQAIRAVSHAMGVALVLAWQLDCILTPSIYLVHIHILKKGMVLEMLSL